MVGTVKQKLFIKGVPDGMTMTIVRLNTLPPDPPQEWRAYLQEVGGNKVKAPIVVDPNGAGGCIGEVVMFGAHPFSINSYGARLEIIFVLSPSNATSFEDPGAGDASEARETGEAEEADDGTGRDYGDIPAEVLARTPKPRPVVEDTFDVPQEYRSDDPKHQWGRIIVETTWWGLIQRPDFCLVSYQWNNQTPQMLKNSIPMIPGMPGPDDSLFVIGYDAEKKEIGINGTTKMDVANTLASYAMRGILWVHKEAAGWVIESFTP